MPGDDDRLQEAENDDSTFDPAQYIPRERRSMFGSAALEALPDEAKDGRGLHARQPHLGYGLLAIVIGMLAMTITTLTVLGIGARLHLVPSLTHLVPSEIPKSTILGEALGYGLTLAILIPLFRRMWRQPFAAVLHMKPAAALANVGKLLLFGVALSVLAQAAESLLTLPKDIPLDAFFKTPADVWCVALFGTLVAPPIEELLFRGFLLPGFAIAFDWLRLPRTPEARLAWASTESLSRAALIFAGVVTSLLFGAIHASQLGFAWNAVALLSCVGGVLAAVRVRFDSVWASSIVHMVYNGFIFVLVFFATGGFRHLERLHGH